MSLFLVAAMALAVRESPSVPLESQAISAVAKAQSDLRAGRRGLALASLDSLLMKDGVNVAFTGPVESEPAVAAVIDEWNQQLEDRPFRLVPRGEKADVTVRFVPSLDAEGSDVQGYIRASRQLSWDAHSRNYRLNGTIFVRDNAEGRKLDAGEIQTVVAHEFGHLLGLADVDRFDRLMGPLTLGRPMLGPTPEEIDVVKDYRGLLRRTYPNK